MEIDLSDNESIMVAAGLLHNNNPTDPESSEEDPDVGEGFRVVL